MPPRSKKRKASAKSKMSKQPESQPEDLAVELSPLNELGIEEPIPLDEIAPIELIETDIHIDSPINESVMEVPLPLDAHIELIEADIHVNDNPINELDIEVPLPLEGTSPIDLIEADIHVDNPTNESGIEVPLPSDETAHIELIEADIHVQESGLPLQPVVEEAYPAIKDCAVVAIEEETAADTVIEDCAVVSMEEIVADTVMDDCVNDSILEIGVLEEERMAENKNDNCIQEVHLHLVQDFDNENKENKQVEVGVGDEHNLGAGALSDESQRTLIPFPEVSATEVETVVAQTECSGNDIPVVKKDFIEEGERKGEECDDGANNEDSDQDDEGNGDYDNPSSYCDTSLTGSKKDKNFEIYIGKLDKGTVEDDLIKIFEKFGELKSTRIVRNPTTKKSKGFAFIQFASANHARNALSELKDGVEVKGKHVKISASQENDTIYIGNICKTWSKEDVLGKLKEYGINNLEEIHLPDDPKNDGKIKGFAMLEFGTHSDAKEAFNRLRKPDAIFGRDKSAKVAFTQSPMHPSEEVLSQVKRVYFEGLTKAWNDEKLKEICSQYGEVVKIDVCRNRGKKHKSFGFITFASPEGALACVEGINKANIKDGEVEVKASMANPQQKGQLQKQGCRGGFKAEKHIQVTPSKKESQTAKEIQSSKVNGYAKSKKGKSRTSGEQKEKTISTSSNVEQGYEKSKKGKSRTSGEQKEKAISTLSNVEQGNARKTQDSIGSRKIGTASKSERKTLKRKKPSNIEDRRAGSTEHTRSKRPLKKPRGSERGKERNNTRNRNRDPHNRQVKNYGAESANHRNLYATAYAVSPAYQVGNAHAVSGSVARGHYTDMEPHAGYLEPVAVKQGPVHSGYVELSSGSELQPHAGYLEPLAGRQGQLHTRYIEHTPWTQSSSGYIQNDVRVHVGPHAGHLQPVVTQQGLEYSYSSGLRRTSGYDGQGSSGYVFGGVGSTVPAAYIPTHTRYYAGYQDGGYNYQIGGAHPFLPRRFH